VAIHFTYFLKFPKGRTVLFLFVVFKGAGEPAGGMAYRGSDARAVEVFVQDGDGYGEIKACGKAAGVLQAAERGKADHLSFVIAYGSAAAAVVDIRVHLYQGPAADGLFDSADDTGGQGRFDRGFGGYEIIVCDRTGVAIYKKLLSHPGQAGGGHGEYRHFGGGGDLQDGDVLTWHGQSFDDDGCGFFDSIGMPVSIFIAAVDDINIRFQVIEDHGKEAGVDGSIGIVEEAPLLFGEAGGPGALQCGDACFGDLAEGGQDELASDKGVIAFDEMTIGRHIAIAGDEKPCSGRRDLFRLFDIVESSLKEAGGPVVHFPEHDVEFLFRHDATTMVQVLYGIEQGVEGLTIHLHAIDIDIGRVFGPDHDDTRSVEGVVVHG